MQSQSINESHTIAHQIELPPQETQEPMPIGKYQPNVGKYTSPMDPMGWLHSFDIEPSTVYHRGTNWGAVPHPLVPRIPGSHDVSNLRFRGAAIFFRVCVAWNGWRVKHLRPTILPTYHEGLSNYTLENMVYLAFMTNLKVIASRFYLTVWRETSWGACRLTNTEHCTGLCDIKYTVDIYKHY